MPSMVYIREIDPFSFLHFNHNGQSFRLFKFTRSANGDAVREEVMKQNDPNNLWADDIIALTRKELNCKIDAPRKGRDKQELLAAWCDYVQALNETIEDADLCDLAGKVQFIDSGIAPPAGRTPVAVRSNKGRVVPRTDMRHFYKLFEDFSSLECHLALAKEAARVPQRLASRFKKSVDYFSRYENQDEGFLPSGPRAELPNHEHVTQIGSTDELSSFLIHQQAGIGTVENDDGLDFCFVEREVIATRTTGNAIYDDGTSAARGLQLDWLLANSADKTPIISEIKIGDDKNLFYALVQSLMYAAEFVTQPQRERLSRHYRCDWPDTPEQVDIYLIVSSFNERSRLQSEIFATTNQLCESIIDVAELGEYVRRIVCLDACLDADRSLKFRSLFRCDRQNG